MEANTTREKTEVIDLTIRQNYAEESAVSHDSDFDDDLGVLPDSLNITVNETGETFQLSADENDDVCGKGNFATIINKIFLFF